jgi:hypothetical protein
VSKSFSPLLGLSRLAITASGCTTTHAPDKSENSIGGAVQQPLRDVSLLREEPPEILKRAAAAPYSLKNKPDCGAMLAEIASLDEVLGPDVDKVEVDEGFSINPAGVAAGAIRGVVGLPFRGVIRMLSGADQRDRVLADAIVSGIARRAFLRGAALVSACQESTKPLSSPASHP